MLVKKTECFWKCCFVAISFILILGVSGCSDTPTAQSDRSVVEVQNISENTQDDAEEYERIMTTYFPVSVEQLRKYCKYDEDSNSYEYEMIYSSPYPPFGEVVDQFAEDGSFQYLGNEFLNDGIMQIPYYQYRVKESLFISY